MSIVLVVILSMLGGCALVLAVLALVQFYRKMGQVVEAGKTVAGEMLRLAGYGNEIVTLLNQIKSSFASSQAQVNKLGEMGAAAIHELSGLTIAMKSFNTLMFSRPEDSRGLLGTGAVGESAVYSYSEKDAAERETEALLRRHGVETNPNLSQQPMIPRVPEAAESPTVGRVEPPPPPPAPSATEATTVQSTPA